jgi:hypothetical protein
MPTKATIMNSLGYLEGWLEKAGKEQGLIVEVPLQHLKTLDDALRDYRRREQTSKNNEQTQTQEKPKFSMDEGTPTSVLLEFSGDPDNFGNVFVHITSADGADYKPGRVFRGPSGVCFELWPIPRKFIMTLTELKALVKEMEARKDRLPFDSGQPGIS